MRQPDDKKALETAKAIAAKTSYGWDQKIEIDSLLEEATRELSL
jgi:hypothetical protein